MTETYNGYANRETWAFNLHWQNDQGLYSAVLEFAQDWIDGQVVDDPDREVADSELGAVVVSWWRDLVLDDEDSTPPNNSPLGMWRNEVGSWWRIDYAEVGAAVRESLGIED